MKILIKFTVFFVVSIFVFVENSFSQGEFSGDLEVHNGSPNLIAVRIYCSSIPFDGLVQNWTSWAPLNRIDTLQNGPYTRLFKLGGSVTNYPLYYHYTELSPSVSYVLGLVGGNPTDSNSAYGHANYTIVVEVKNTNIKYISTFNYLDSKFGSSVNGHIYGRDIILNFRTVGQPIEVSDTNIIGYINPYQVGQPVPEFKIWEICGFGNTPLEKRFYARTTPFGITPKVIYDTTRHFIMREFDIGTKVIFDGVYDNYGANDRWGYNTFKDYVADEYLDYYNNPKIPQGQNLPGYTYTTPAFYTIGETDNVNGCRINALSGDELILKNNMRLWISGYNRFTNSGDTLVLNSGSILTKEQNSQLNACLGGTILDYGAILNWEQNSFSHIFTKSEYSFLGSSHTINNGGHIEFDNLARLKVGDNTTVTFDGAGTYLKLNSGAIVQLGHNAKIEFKNGAYIDANGSIISSMDDANPAAGLVFENAGASTITNCIFNNLITPVYISNSGTSTQYIQHNISGNTFNMNNLSAYGIRTTNTNNIIVTNNTINLHPGIGIGIYFKYPSNTLDGVPTGVNTDNINILYNRINGGNVSAMIYNLTDSYVNINFNNNTLTGSAATKTNVIAIKLSGFIKYNSITGADEAMQFNEAIPNVFGNYIQSRDLTLYFGYNSPNLSPNQTMDNNWVWLGGQNKIYSINTGNIYFDQGLPQLDWGQNCFSKNASSAYYHLSGTITSNTCYVRNNDFNASNNPTSLLTGPNGDLVNPYYYGSDFGCINSTDRGQIWQINNLGGGFYDTVYKTTSTNQNPPAEDEATYSGAILKREQKSYFDAISQFKMLINNYPQSGYTDGCLYDLYESYKRLDTSSLQSNRDIIFTDLENYLNGKIQSGIYSDNFNMTAYEIIAMCKVNILDYNDAMSSYEFISLYHPDAYIRLLASWDYAEVQALLNGSGSGISSNTEKRSNSKTVLSDAEYKDKLIKKINKSISIDPSKQQVKKSFDRQKEKSLNAAVKSEIEKSGLDNEKAKKKIESIRRTEEDKSTSKVISVLRNAKSMTKAEREKRQVEDVIFGAPQHSGKKETGENTNSLPVRYELSQNYPNPFNPVTKINFSIQKQGLVTLKVYDMLGREVASLVNEFKQAGYYSLDFNASGLSSGIYFYKLQANDFSDIKKMVLVK